MLGFGNEGVMSVVPHYLREQDVFKNLARYTCEGDGSVVSSFLFMAFLVYSDHIRGEPVLGEASIPKGFSEFIYLSKLVLIPDCTPSVLCLVLGLVHWLC